MFNIIRFDTDILMKCLDCKVLFWIDGDSRIGSNSCVCGSKNMDRASRSDLKRNTFELVDDEIKKLQRKMKKKTDRTPEDFETYALLLDRWSKRKPKK